MDSVMVVNTGSVERAADPSQVPILHGVHGPERRCNVLTLPYGLIRCSFHLKRIDFRFRWGHHESLGNRLGKAIAP